MASVGVLAAIINVVVLVAVAVADRALEMIVRNFAACRLRKERRAPVVHDSDTWLPYIPRSVIKYHKYPAILTAVLCTIFLIASEVITELGVDVSNKCKPVQRSGSVITMGDATDNFTEVELGTSAFFLQSTTFLDGNLSRVPSDMPRGIKGTECIKCMNEEEYPSVLSGCTVSKGRVYDPGELTISVVTTTGPYLSITKSFKETGPSKREFKGRGDLTRNGVHWGTFVFFPSSADEMTYMEYGNQVHIEQLAKAAREIEGTSVTEEIRSPVESRKVTCAKNELSIDHFERALTAYRTIQLENPIRTAMFNVTAQRFQDLYVEDVYKAALSMKVIDDEHKQGTYWEYTTCGRYKWSFLFPIIACLIFIMALFVVSAIISPRLVASEIPYNSRTWFRHAQGISQIHQKERSSGRKRSGYFNSVFDEMVLMEEAQGQQDSYQIDFTSPDCLYLQESTPDDVEQQGPQSSHLTNFSW